MGKLRLAVAVVVVLAITAGGIPISAQQAQPRAQQPPQQAATGALQGVRTGLFASIQGTAVNWTNSAMAHAPIRLRDARLGRVVNTATSDTFGAFEFRSLEPGSYVVELLAPNDTVLAATPIINIGSGQSVAALIKVPFKTPPLGGAFGNSLASVLAITSAAAAAGVLATSVAGAPATTRSLPGQ